MSKFKFQILSNNFHNRFIFITSNKKLIAKKLINRVLSRMEFIAFLSNLCNPYIRTLAISS